MKTKILSLMLLVASGAGLTSCSDDNWNPDGNSSTEGTLSLSSMDVDVAQGETLLARAGVNTDGYLVEIVNAESGVTENSYVYAQMPEVITLPVGDYTVNVESHKVKDAEFDAPYFVGSKEFSITAGKLTEIGTVTCKFSNIKVSIRYTEELAKMLGDDSNVKVVANDNGTLNFGRAETRSGYFAAVEGSTTLVAHFTATIDGNAIQAIKTFTDVAAGQHHIITFSVKNGSSTVPDEFGTISPTGITVDAEIEHEDIAGNVTADEDNTSGTATRPGTEEWPDDEPTTPDDPVVDPAAEPITFNGNGLNLDGGTNPVNLDEYIIDIHADNGIANLFVKIESDNEAFIASAGQMVPMNFDMAHLDDENYEKLASIGLEGNAAVLGKTDVPFDISALVPLLESFPGTHTFTITVTDSEGNTLSKKLIIVA